MDTNGQLIRALSRLVTACELEQQGLCQDAKPALLRAVAEGRAVLQEVVQGAGRAGVMTPSALETERAVETVARDIYDEWKGQNGWVPWVDGGNSTKQDEARRCARDAIAGLAAPAAAEV